MEKVEVTVDAEGQEQYGVRKRHNLRGTRFSLPKPKVGAATPAPSSALTSQLAQESCCLEASPGLSSLKSYGCSLMLALDQGSGAAGIDVGARTSGSLRCCASLRWRWRSEMMCAAGRPPKRRGRAAGGRDAAAHAPHAQARRRSPGQALCRCFCNSLVTYWQAGCEICV